MRTMRHHVASHTTPDACATSSVLSHGVVTMRMQRLHQSPGIVSSKVWVWEASRRGHGPHAAVAAQEPMASETHTRRLQMSASCTLQAPISRQRRGVPAGGNDDHMHSSCSHASTFTSGHSALDMELLCALAQQLQVSIDAVEELNRRQPQLLGRKQSINLLAAKLHELQQRLDLQMHEVITMVSRQPAIVSSQVGALVQQLREVAAVLGVEQDVFNSLVAKQPEFLEVPPLRLSMRAAQLAVLLNLSKHPSPAKQRKHAYTSPAAPAAVARLQQQRDSELPYPRRGVSLLDREAATELAMQCEMNLGDILQPWEQAAAMQNGTLIPPQHLKGGSAAMQRRLSADPNSVAAIGSSRAAQQPHSLGVHTAQLAASARLAGQREAEAESAAKLAGLQVLARLPSQQFFELVALPGSALVARLLALEDQLQLGTPQATTAMVSQCPAILVQPLQATMDAWMALQAGPLQGVAPGAGCQWLLRCPNLLCCPASQLTNTFAAICSELGLPAAAASKRVMQTPFLMRRTAEEFVRQLQVLEQLLQISAFEARRMVRNAPNIINYSEAALSRKVSDLAQLLHLDQAQVTDVLLRQPALLTHAVTTLQQKLKQLHSLLGVTPTQLRHMVLSEPTLLTCKPASLHAKAERLQTTFGWTSPQLQQLLLHMPGLVLVPKARLQQHLIELSLLLDLPIQPWVCQLVSAWPRSLAGQCTAEEVVGALGLLVQHLHKVRQQQGSCVHVMQQPQGHGQGGHTSQPHHMQHGDILTSEAESLQTAIQAVSKRPELLERAMRKYLEHRSIAS